MQNTNQFKSQKFDSLLVHVPVTPIGRLVSLALFFMAALYWFTAYSYKELLVVDTIFALYFISISLFTYFTGSQGVKVNIPKSENLNLYKSGEDFFVGGSLQEAELYFELNGINNEIILEKRCVGIFR